jgi:hypothetical protein
MRAAAKPDMNVKRVVPFFRISDVDRSIRFYMHGLGLTMKHKRLVDEKLLGAGWKLVGAALMLQTYVKDSPNAPVGKLGQGVSLSSRVFSRFDRQCRCAGVNVQNASSNLRTLVAQQVHNSIGRVERCLLPPQRQFLSLFP